MDKDFNPSKFGLTLQRLICEKYDIEENEYARKQFDSNSEENFADEIKEIIPKIQKLTGATPVELLTFTSDSTGNKKSRSPHNFLLSDGRTLSLRTTIGSGKVAPRTVGQAGFPQLNEYFGEFYGKEIVSQEDVRSLMFDHIHQALPIFIENFFPSDYNIIIERDDAATHKYRLTLYKASEIADYTFNRDELSFTRNLDTWVESNTLKYHGVSIAELQTHKNRTFKFRFILKSIPEWLRIAKDNNETFGITAEAAVCKAFNLEMPESFAKRVSAPLLENLIPIAERAFESMPKAIRHTGSEKGDRGESSKCPYDFVLEGDKTLSLKTNKKQYVCPPEVGQPGAATCLMYFKEFLPAGTTEVTGDLFKHMVYAQIENLIPVYLSHLFDSDWLLWIYKTGERFRFETIHRDEIAKDTIWDRSRFSFSKPTAEEWNESNTVKYDGLTIGIFQVHNHRSSFKFRFHMPNLLKLLRRK